MQDPYGRTIRYLRVSITDRCNLRCRYCMPEEGVASLDHDEIMSYEEIVDFVRTTVDFGIDKVRVTGGEPLVRRGVVGLIGELATIDGITDLSMTTNGTLLPQFAQELRDAGLMRVNISLDTVDPRRFEHITRKDCLDQALAGINAAIEVGFDPIKINCVIDQSSDEPDARAVAEFVKRLGLEIRYIPRMELSAGRFGRVEGGEGGHCARCDRLRLSADGWLRPCLFSTSRINVRQRGYQAAIREAILTKPERGIAAETDRMNEIGG